ncbi:MAG TPA: hypothetical protein VLY03_02405 [Bacteroidota bacterium]|nr:hypothetical protein [Bacteroidota bacterium]
MWKTTEGSTGRLIQLCIGYFIFYIVFLVATKYFTDFVIQGSGDAAALKAASLHMNMEFLVYSTIGGNLLCLLIVFAFRWYKMKSNRFVRIAGMDLPSELLYIIPSGVCTAVVIPTTTLMYTLPISVMVAMVIMRGSIIVISRIVDAIQIAQGILKKKVYIQEEMGVLFAIMAVSVQLFYDRSGKNFDFITYTPAIVILASYVSAYFIRLYFMNYYKNTRGKGVRQDNKGFFAVEQITAGVVLCLVGLFVYHSRSEVEQILLFRASFTTPSIHWNWEVIAGAFFGAQAFLSVFLFMFKGRTATFSALVNRLTSLIAGTASTLVVYFLLGGKFPEDKDWVSLLFIFIAVGFLSVAERKRSRELAAAAAVEHAAEAAKPPAG